MTTFKEIRGTTIEVVSTDPTNPETGQIWYNSSSGTLKGYGISVPGSFSSGGTMNSGRASLTGFGTQTAAVGAGGYFPGYFSSAESYNGSSWTSITGLPAGRSLAAGVGTQTAGLVMGSDPISIGTSALTYNGSTWTSSPSLGTAFYAGGASGNQTAALKFAGVGPGGTTNSATESYNGSSWTAVNSLNIARRYSNGTGTQTAALCASGYSPTYPTGTAVTESWNGTSWTNLGNMVNTRYGYAGSMFGSQTVAYYAGGTLASPPGAITNLVESWNGSAWSNNPSTLASGRTASYKSTQPGSETAGLVFGGYNPAFPSRGLTEAWNGPSIQTKTLTVS